MTWPDIKHQPTPRTANNTNIVTTLYGITTILIQSPHKPAEEAHVVGNILKQS